MMGLLQGTGKQIGVSRALEESKEVSGIKGEEEVIV